ncbi:MAG: PAS-domain containing protein [Gammaproteobacteria bacterium]|nr:PAS-domain containing protein [Gammaproteobacteria bacterium]
MKNRWPTRPVRVDIFARLLLALLLVALLPLTVYWQLERRRMAESGAAEAQQRLRLFADRVIQQVDDWARLNLAAMQIAASQTDMRSMQPAAQRRTLATLMPQLPWAYLIHTTDLTGINVARSDDGPPAIYRDRSYYKEILAGQRFAVEVQIGRTSHRPAFLLAVPIGGSDGSVHGLLIEASTLDHVAGAVTSARLGRTGYAFLLTPEGRLIASGGESLQLKRGLEDYSHHPGFRVARGGDGLYRYTVAGIERVAQIRHTQLGWIAVVQQDVAENLEAVTQANRYAWVLLALTAAAVTLFSALVARSFAIPIAQATRVATAISSGQLDVSVESDRRDQIGDLMRAMQEMRHTLQQFLDTQSGLAAAAARGDFSKRGDETAFHHAYGDMVRHLNRLMDTADRGFGELAVVLAAIARGDLTVSMQGDYEGTFAALQRDTNATVRSLAALIEQIEIHRNLLHATLEHLPQGISVVDGNLRIMAWNRRYEEIFSYPPGLLQLGRPIESLMQNNAARGLMGGKDAVGEIQRRLGHLRNGAPYSSERVLPNGTVLEIRGNAVPGVGYVTSFSDITAYKDTERALRVLTESLERRVQERTEALLAAKADAERANSSKTRFVAAAVHDLMQPLDAARMFVSAVRTRLDGRTELQLLDSIDSALSAEGELLASLLDISRLESGTFEVQEREFSVGPLLEALGREFGMLASTRGIGLHVVGTRAAVRSDESLLRRILQNFLANAVRYTQQGRIVMGCRRSGTLLRIEVWDTGPGIPKADWQRIFLEFQRLDTGRHANERGSGLGLAIVKRIGNRLNHAIGLRSWPGRGSVFSVSVPHVAVVPTTALAVRRISEDAPSLAGLRVWCLDDDALVRDGARALLQGWGCVVTLASSGKEALQLAASCPAADLLLVDYRLTDGVGPGFVADLRRLWGAAVPVIVISAERDPALRASMRDQEISFLAKPVRPAELRALLMQLLMRAAAPQT